MKIGENRYSIVTMRPIGGSSLRGMPRKPSRTAW
jgi:hypothetical protein